MPYLRVNFILAILIIAAMIIEGISADDETCGENEKHMDCGTHCQPTCADPTGSSMPCNHMCAIGCFCVDDHVRKTDENSPCVHKTEC